MSIAGPAAKMPSEARLDMSWLATVLVFIVRLLVGTVALHGNLWPERGEAFSMLLSWLVISCDRLNSEMQTTSTNTLVKWQAHFSSF